MKLHRYFRRRYWDQERARELESYLEHEIEDNLMRGMTPEEARRRAYLKLGNPTRIREEIRQMNSMTGLESLWRDVRYALRQLRMSPGFTITAVLTLALGMGATTAIFSLIHSALRLPFPDASRLVSVKNVYPTASYLSDSYPDFVAWRDRNQTFERLAAVFTGNQETYLSSQGPVLLRTPYVSLDFFSLFGLRPIAGRAFSADDERKGASPVCILSENFWKGQFGGSRSVLGRTLTLSGRNYVVIGVLPNMTPSFFRKAEVWLPLDARPPYDQHGTNYLYVTGLLKPGVSVQKAQNDLELIQQQINKQFPENAHAVELQLLSKTFFGNLRPVMLVLLAAVGFILLIACVNLANMMLARSAERMREFGVRQALGASPLRLLRQSFTESALLATLGGVAGLVLAGLLIRIPVHAWPSYLEAPRDVHLNAGILLFSVLLVAVTSLLFGAAPAFQVLRFAGKATAHQDMRTMSESREQRLMRSGLMVVEIAFATLLVGGALSMTLYFTRLLLINPGINPKHVLSMTVVLPTMQYKTDEAQRGFFDALQQELARLPGVTSVGGVDSPPYSGDDSSSSYTYENGPPFNSSRLMFADGYFVTPGYLHTMQVPLLYGRWFTHDDTTKSAKVVVINKSLADRLWPRQTALGKWINIGLGTGKQLVIGVVDDVRHSGVAEPADDQVYFSAGQYPRSSLVILIRTQGDPVALTNAARQTARAINPNVLITAMAPVTALAMQSVGEQSTATALMGMLGLLALLLASVGVYGVIAYAVSRREREFGIRMALGSRRGQIFALLLRSTLQLVAFGLGLGMLLTFPLNGWMRSLLGNGEGFYPSAMAGTAILLGVVALIAAIIPARRAASVDPMRALRAE